MNPFNPWPIGIPNKFKMDSSSPSSSIDQALYLCIAKGGRIVHSFNNGDRETEALAALCLACAPPFHSWYFHTDRGKTYGFLIEDGYTYFVIADATVAKNSGAAALRLLQSARDGFRKAAKNGVQDELIPVLRSLMTYLESMSRPAADDPGPSTVSAKAPLMGRISSSSGWNERKMKDRVGDSRSVSEGCVDRTVNIDLLQESEVGAASLQKSSSSSSKVRGQQVGRRMWCRHVKIIIAIDALICLVLFGIWMLVCRGFQCVSN